MNNTTKIILAIIMTAITITIGFLFSRNSTDQISQTAKQTTYDKIIKTGKIRIGYTSNPPAFIIDPNSGKFTGVFPEVLEEIAKKLQLELEYKEDVGWESMIEAVKSKRVDAIITGIWPATERGKHADFTNPLYHSPVKAYVRIDDNRFDGDLSKIDNQKIKIAIIDGEMTALIAQIDYPKATKINLSQLNHISELLLQVQTRKADVTFLEPAIAMEYIAKNPGKIKEVQGVSPVRVFPNTIMVDKGEIELLSTLNIAIEELVGNGFVDKVVKKYEKYPDTLQRRTMPFRNNK